ncbi:pyrimidodiazepine synthase-like [Copidosoma floridanum]|uniref:pyrimidodiazepine synthase-like n=1 Tax=Copidosoma floridanum TaxID=29053 RepID=UPI0006C9A9BB|nr:pyrimidodiazepine synthase-like [Copidosoma floridanum]
MGSSKHLTVGSKAPPLEKGKLRLYSMRFCPYAQRIHLVLDAKKISYDVVYVNLSQKPEWLQEKSPLGKVPCIEFENGDTLYESLIIAEYLDEAYPEHRLLPTNPLTKAKDKLLTERFNDFITSMYKLLIDKTVNKDLFDEVLKGLEIFERELNKRGTPFFGGSQPGMLDLMIWPWCERADVLRILKGKEFVLPQDRFSRLLKWRTAMQEDESVKGSYLDAEIHVKYLQSRQAGAPQYDLLA